jgi:hypothetical protein
MIAERRITLTFSEREATELWRFISFATPSKFATKSLTSPLDWQMLGDLKSELAQALFSEPDA